MPVPLGSHWKLSARTKRRQSLASVKRWKRRSYRAKLQKHLHRLHKTVISEATRKRNLLNWRDPDYRKRMKRVCSEAGTKAMLGLWKSPEFQKRRARSFGKNPSRVAIKLFYRLRNFGFRLEYPLGAYSIDIAHPEKKLAVEVDGGYWHSGREEHDRKKDKFLKALGWTVLRISALRARSHRRECVSLCLENL